VIRVLIVDDQPDVRLAFAYMLEALGCTIGEAHDGVAALAYLAKNRVDVVLTDMYMPGMDGLGLVRAVRSGKPPYPRIIVMSGSENLGMDASLEAAKVLGADAVLRKPITRDRLLNTIRDLMGEERGKRLGH
jgi:CheY-like chemotaxis protein